jgi:hypothetical protein
LTLADAAIHGRTAHRRAMFVPNAKRTAKIVHETRLPLIVRERYDLAIDPRLLGRTRRELLGSSPHADADESFRSGFLLGVQADPATHPACLELAGQLHRRMLDDLESQHGLQFALSFYKLAQGTPPKAGEGPFYEGPHLDTHPALTESVELLRLLVNLSSHPRRFLYTADDRWLLAQQGVRYGRREFQILALPPGTDTRVVVLPGRSETSVHALKFFASAIPHVGLNDPPEHFLVSFEALAEVQSR